MHINIFCLSIHYTSICLSVYLIYLSVCLSTEIPDYFNKISHMRNVVRSLPAPNRDTMEALFSHLRKYVVILLHACIYIFFY